MSLPDITLPHIALPFDIPTMLHPLFGHFIVALPIVIFLIELGNIVLKKRAVSGITYFLLILVLIATSGAYLLTQDAVASEHKTLGTYLMLGTALLLVFKFLFMFSQKMVTKLLYILMLGFFIFAVLVYDKENVATTTTATTTKHEIEPTHITSPEVITPATEVKTEVEKEEVVEVVERPSEATKEATPEPVAVPEVKTETAPAKVETNASTASSISDIKENIKTAAKPLIDEVKANTGTLLDSVVNEVKDASKDMLDTVKEKVSDAVKDNVIDALPTDAEKAVQ